jgi:hypothetical protein
MAGVYSFLGLVLVQAQVFQNREGVRDQFFELLRQVWGFVLAVFTIHAFLMTVEVCVSQFRKVYYYSVDASNISEFESQFSTRVRAIAADVLPDNWECVCNALIPLAFHRR